MMDPYGCAGGWQPSDPRLRPVVIPPPTKIARLEYQQLQQQQQCMGSFGGTMPSAGPAPSDEDLSSKIMDKLKMLTGRAPEAAPEPDLGSLLSGAIANLGAGACGSSQEGQQLYQHVQQGPHARTQLAPSLMHDALFAHAARLAASQIAAPAFVEAQLPSDAIPGAPAHEVMSAADLAAFTGDDVSRPRSAPVALKPLCEDDEDEDDESVPHRLPPGFGAIPEDIVAERQRLKEDERLRQIKSTQPCRFGRMCKKRDCPNLHQEGRSIDTNLNPCAFGRRCKRMNCFYDHPDGRDIDEDPTKGMCRLAEKCKRPDCLYAHPANRELAVADVRVCFFCHEGGHIAPECPNNPESWCFRQEGARQVPALPALPPSS